MKELYYRAKVKKRGKGAEELLRITFSLASARKLKQVVLLLSEMGL